MQKFSILVLMIVLTPVAISQPAVLRTKKNPYKWMFGLSWSAVDDNGNAFGQLFDISGSWNYELFPSRFFIDRYFKKGWSMEGAFVYNEYNKSRQINDTSGVEGAFVSGDLNVKYSFNRFFRSARWFDPYISMGLGVTYRAVRAVPVTPTFQTNIGVNFWFSRRWGAQLQASGKLALVTDIYSSDADYTNYTIGILYRIDPKKRSSSQFSKRRHQWTNEKQRFKRRNS
ncbi:MAG: hypothetical protein ACK45H_14365 [Bacteroidota bacterium]|jgi:hypothetical protein